MTPEERQLQEGILEMFQELSDRHDRSERECNLRLKRLENDIDLLEIAIDRFYELLEFLAKLSQLIRTAFLESRIWEELEEYRKNDGKRKRKSGGRNTGGFDVQRKPRKPEE